MGTAPLEAVFGTREIPVETAVAVRAGIDHLVQDDTVPEDEPWRTLQSGHESHRRRRRGSARSGVDLTILATAEQCAGLLIPHLKQGQGDLLAALACG